MSLSEQSGQRSTMPEKLVGDHRTWRGESDSGSQRGREAEGRKRGRSESSSSSCLSSSSSEPNRRREKRKKEKKERVEKKDKDKKKKKEKKKKHKREKEERKKKKEKTAEVVHDVGAIKGAEPLFNFQKARVVVNSSDQSQKLQAVTEERSKMVQAEKLDLPPDSAPKKKAMVPMTREQAEEGKDRISKIFDEDTGRWRMVRGDGEIIERIVSQSEARAINKQATHWISKPGAKGY